MSQPIRILIVEDKAIIADDIALKLSQLGYAIVDIAEDGETALAMAARHQPDLVLMDIRLPGGMDGIETAKRLLETRALPIIYLTAHSDEAIVQRAMQTGPAAYIVKPFDTRELQIAIDLAVHNFAEKQEQAPEPEPTEFVVQDSIFLKRDHRFEKVAFTDILYIEAHGSYVDICTPQRTYTLTMNMASFGRKFHAPEFMRVHRSYTINLTKVQALEPHKVVIEGVDIPVSKQYRKELMERFRVL